MKMLKLAAFVCFTLLVFDSCDCRNTCAAYNNDFMPQQLDDTIRFTNGNGDFMQFVVLAKSATESYELTASAGKCSIVDECSKTKGDIMALGNTGRNGKSELQITASRGNTQDQVVLLDFYRPLYVHPNSEKFETLQLGNTLYDSVITRTMDTSLSYNIGKAVWRVYLSHKEGIIAFDDRQTRSRFYLQ